MENVSNEYAKMSHNPAIRTYSQYLFRTREGEWHWRINTLDNLSRENIINNIQSKKEVTINKTKTTIQLEQVSVIDTSFDELFGRNYIAGDGVSRYVDLRFISPTSFKSEGKYVNYPTSRHILQNLINKYDSISPDTKLYDENVFAHLVDSVEIVGYNLKSVFFHVESVKIPSFVGSITLKINGGKNMMAMVNMLADFAEFSGVGIKSAMGMGAVIRKKEV